MASELWSNIKKFGPALAKVSEFMGEAGGWMNWFGVGPGRRNQHATESGAKSEGKPIEVNSWGAQDEEGILYLLSKYGIPPEMVKEGLEPIQPSPDESQALSRMFGHMTNGEMDAFKRIIARGNEQGITVKVPIKLKLEKTDRAGDVIGTAEKVGYREYTIFAAIRGSHILRSIGKDILRAEASGTTERAEQLAEEFRDLGLLKNWPDLAQKIWDKVKIAKPGTNIYAMRQEAWFRYRLGQEGFDYIRRGPAAIRLQEEVDQVDPKDPEAKAKAERVYWTYFGEAADLLLSDAIQRDAARKARIIHPNRWPWLAGGGVLVLVIAFFIAVAA